MSATVIPFDEPKMSDPLCSFCGKPKSACKSFVSGHTHNICGECIKKCQTRLAQGESK